jgi:hypothetical protein
MSKAVDWPSTEEQLEQAYEQIKAQRADINRLLAAQDASRSSMSKLEAENAGLRVALQFYAKEWREEAHLTRTWQEPTDELFEDAGNIARKALSSPMPNPLIEEVGKLLDAIGLLALNKVEPSIKLTAEQRRDVWGRAARVRSLLPGGGNG